MLHHPLSAAQVEETRSSAAVSPRAWRAGGSRPNEVRHRSGLVLTRLRKPCDRIGCRAEERAWWAGTKPPQEAFARRALLVSWRSQHREVSPGYLGKLRTRPRQRGSTGQPTDWRRKLANAEWQPPAGRELLGAAAPMFFDAP